MSLINLPDLNTKKSEVSMFKTNQGLSHPPKFLPATSQNIRRRLKDEKVVKEIKMAFARKDSMGSRSTSPIDTPRNALHMKKRVTDILSSNNPTSSNGTMNSRSR